MDLKLNLIDKAFVFNYGTSNESLGYATGPTVFDVNKDLWRIYFSYRDNNGFSIPSYIDVKKYQPQSIQFISDKPLLELGNPGSFDDSGITIGSLNMHKDELFLYYLGWTQRTSIPYDNSIGLAKSVDNGFSFTKVFEGPILTKDKHEPYGIGACFANQDQDQLFHMWYTSIDKWRIFGKEIYPQYNIKYASSNNGIDWQRDKRVSIDYKNDHECIARPVIVKYHNYFHMFYCYRDMYDFRTNKNKSYKIGYANSVDGIFFHRKDHVVDIGDLASWEQEMQAYPHVLIENNQLWIFYNGNGFGKSGFGYAKYDIE